MENKKIKIEIENRWTGNVLFEYEKENNTIKETLEKAVKKGVNLYGANLVGANLVRANLYGADLRGAYLYLYDSEELENKDEIISNFEEQTGIKIKSTYINKHVLSPYYLTYWKNGLIIDKYEYIGKEEIKEEDTKFDLDNATYNEKYLYEKIKELMEE